MGVTMAEIGTAYVSLLPSAKGFGSAVEKELGPAGTKAGATASKGFSGTFVKGIGALAYSFGALFAVDKVKDFFVSAVSEARESQKVSALTANVIKSTGGAAHVSAKQVGELATAISNKTGIDDEAVQSASNLLLTFTNVRNEVGKGNDVFDQATQAAADLGATMGKDPKSAAIQLGKALNDPTKGITALTRSGVSFTDQQKKQIAQMQKSGDLMGAQKVILKEVNREFGGAAAASSTAGEKAAVAWGNLKEQIGTVLLPILDKVEGVVANKVIPAISDFIAGMQSGKGPGGDLADALRQVWEVAELVWPVLKTVGKFLADNVPLILAVAAAYLAWQVALIAYNTVQAIQLALLMIATPGTFLNAAATAIAATATAVWAAAMWLLTTPLGLVVLGILALIVVVILVIKYHKQIGAFIGKVWGKIKDAIGAAVSWVVNFVKSHWKLLVSIIGGPLAAIVILIISKWGKIKGFIRGALQAIGKIVREGWAHVVGWVTNAGENLVNAVKSIPGRLRALGGLFASAGRWIITAFVNGLKNAGGIISGIAGNVWNALQGLLNGAIDHINSLLEFTIKVGPKSFTINPPDISHLAKGGRARGSVVEVGDGNRWESIIPDNLMVDALTAAARAGAGAGPARGPDQLRLVVDGYEFNAYVDARADDRVASASDLDSQRGRAAWAQRR
jgi:phage-related protein